MIHEKEKNAYDILDSHDVSNPSTIGAQRCLTCQIGRGGVLSARYGRRRRSPPEAGSTPGGLMASVMNDACESGKNRAPRVGCGEEKRRHTRGAQAERQCFARSDKGQSGVKSARLLNCLLTLRNPHGRQNSRRHWPLALALLRFKYPNLRYLTAPARASACGEKKFWNALPKGGAMVAITYALS